MNDSGPTPPPGCRLVVLSRERAITVWDSPEDRDRFFAERLAPAYQAAGRSLDIGIEHQIQARDRPEQRPEIRLARMTTRAQANSRSTTQMRSQSVPICDDDEQMRSSG